MTTTVQPVPAESRIQQRVMLGLHLTVLLGAITLITVISWDTFNNVSFIADPFYTHIQFWICMIFLADIIIGWALARRRWQYLRHNLLFMIVSIPYLSIISRYGLEIPGQIQYVLRFIPMLRAAYVLAIVTGALYANRISSLFMAYMALLIATLYFGSLMFFVEEHNVNPNIHSYWSALWWAIMDMTTCGSGFSPVTTTGKVLGIILSIEGLILFPVFTVYIANALTRRGTSPDGTHGKPKQ